MDTKIKQGLLNKYLNSIELQSFDEGASNFIILYERIWQSLTKTIPGLSDSFL